MNGSFTAERVEHPDGLHELVLLDCIIPGRGGARLTVPVEKLTSSQSLWIYYRELVSATSRLHPPQKPAPKFQ